MKELGFPDRHYLNAAVGWLYFGNVSEACQEIERVSMHGKFHPEVFLVRWRVYARSGQWDRAQILARIFTKVAPDNPTGWMCLSFSLYKLKRRLEAWLQLLPKARAFPRVSAIPYLLACYALEMGSDEEARKWLEKSAALGGERELKRGALDDFATIPFSASERLEMLPKPQAASVA